MISFLLFQLSTLAMCTFYPQCTRSGYTARRAHRYLAENEPTFSTVKPVVKLSSYHEQYVRI